jgi:hypothetical protein
MARLARVVIPDIPHHVTQRGNRRERVFFGEVDYRAYLDLISASAREAGTAIWAYCLMPNHVHFILAPSDADGLGGPSPRRIGDTPPAFTRASGGAATSGKDGSAPPPWTSVICWPPRATCR